MAYKKRILVDFDGVLNSYRSKWKGIDNLPDDPIPGAIPWLTELCQDEDLEVCIWSSRNMEYAGIRAMREWLDRHGFPKELLEQKLTFPTEKPPAHIIIDDRAYCFSGIYPSRADIKQFKPWRIDDE